MITEIRYVKPEDMPAVISKVRRVVSDRLIEVPVDAEFDVPTYRDFGQHFRIHLIGTTTKEEALKVLRDSELLCSYTVGGDSIEFTHPIPFADEYTLYSGKVKLRT